MNSKASLGIFGPLLAVSACGGNMDENKPPRECPGAVEIIAGHNNIESQRINIIFMNVLSAGTDLSEEELVQRVEGALDYEGKGKGLLSEDFFRRNKDAFNFFYYPEPRFVSEYETKSEEGKGFEAKAAVNNIYFSCNLPNKAFFALANWDFIPNAQYSPLHYVDLNRLNLSELGPLQEKYFGMKAGVCRGEVKYCSLESKKELCQDLAELEGIQSNALDANLCNIVAGGDINFGTALIPDSSHYFVGHEAGHSIFGFWDERTSSKKANDEVHLQDLKNYPMNCFTGSRQECESAFGESCFQGCAYLQEAESVPVWRSIERGLMYNGYNKGLGTWNEALGCKVLRVVNSGYHCL